MRRHDDLADAERGRDLAAMEWPGAAEGDQRQLAGIHAALDGQHPNGVRHVLVGEGDDREGGLLRGHAEARRQLLQPGLRQIRM